MSQQQVDSRSDLQCLSEALLLKLVLGKSKRTNQLSEGGQFAFRNLTESELMRFRAVQKRLAKETGTDVDCAARLFFCDAAAAKTLLLFGTTPYRFWQLTALACFHAEKLPLNKFDFYHAIATIRRQFQAEHGNAFGDVLAQPLSEYTSDSLRALAKLGVVFITETPNALTQSDQYVKDRIFDEHIVEMYHLSHTSQ